VLRIDLVVDEVEPSRVRIAFLVDQTDVHDAVLGRMRLLHVLEIRLLVYVEVRVDGSVRNDRCEHDRGIDQVARRHDRARDAARDRRRHARERKVELGGFERRADGRDLRSGDGRIGRVALELLL